MYSEPHDLLTAVLSGVPIHAVQYNMGSQFRQKSFPRRRTLLPQEIQQGRSRNANLSSDADTSHLSAADQLVAGVAADAENRHQVLHPQCHGQLMQVAILKYTFSVVRRQRNVQVENAARKLSRMVILPAMSKTQEA